MTSGVLEQQAVDLLRSFYNRENFHAPDDKRRKKDHVCRDDENNSKQQQAIIKDDGAKSK